MSRVTIRLERPRCDAPNGWEGCVSLWRFVPGSSLERIFISKFDGLPANVPLRVTPDIVGATKTFILVLFLRRIEADNLFHRLYFLGTHQVAYRDVTGITAKDFCTRACLKSNPQTVWIKTDLHSLLKPRKNAQGILSISPPFRTFVFAPRSVSDAPSATHPNWELRVKVGRLISGEDANSPESSDGVSGSDREVEEPKMEIEPIVSKKPPLLKGVRLFHASTHVALTEAEIIGYINGAPLSDVEEDKQWLVHDNAELVEDYIDVEESDKALFKLWNAHVIPIPIQKREAQQICMSFMEACRYQLLEYKLRIPLLQHLTHLMECGLIGRFTFLMCMEYLDIGEWPK